MKTVTLNLSLILLFFCLSILYAGQRTTPLIIDHTCADITKIPQEWIEAAKDSLHIAYGHTSHGSQLATGMTGLVAFANNGGKGLSLPEDIFAWSEGGANGTLDLRDNILGGDVGYYPNWVNNTVAYLGEADAVTGRGKIHPEVNVIIWSWCGQVEDKYNLGTLHSEYLDPMSELEKSYFNVTFIYMTGHVNIWEDAANKAANQIIYDYCVDSNKVLYDFADIEHYNPDSVYFEFVNDNCDYYDENIQYLGNWATEWQESHTEGVDWYTCTSAHSQPLNANQKAYAAWWMWAKLAGWQEEQPREYAAPTLVHAPQDSILPEDCGYVVLINDVRSVFSQPDDGDQFSYTMSSQKPDFGCTMNDFQLCIQPADNFYGEGWIWITAKNSQAKECTDSLFITIAPVNDPPVIVALPDSLHFKSDSSVSLTMNQFAEDIDSPASDLTWKFSPENPALIWTYDSMTTRLDLSAPSFSGQIKLFCTLSDDSSASVSDSITLIIIQSTGIPEDIVNTAPGDFKIYPNFPNPFNPQTTIRYRLPSSSYVTIVIYDILGNRIRTLLKEDQTVGEHRIVWDGRCEKGRSASSGIYYYHIRTDQFSVTQKMVLAK